MSSSRLDCDNTFVNWCISKITMRISVFVPVHGVIEAITPAFRTFNTANEFLLASGKKPVFDVEYVVYRSLYKPAAVNIW